MCPLVISTPAGTRQGGVAGLVGKKFRVNRVRSHDLFPFGPLRVAHLDSHGTALGDAVPDTAEDGHHVLFKLHTCAAPVTQAAAGQ